ncbi:hypothetical protein AURDEDRAFT_162410 [Auricularia subglabra TFB-10046 SS5]|nr:hypothetical protein AURDEDRAFT_162410 [Auricularia subglabra TFB-10046 SS5]
MSLHQLRALRTPDGRPGPLDFFPHRRLRMMIDVKCPYLLFTTGGLPQAAHHFFPHEWRPHSLRASVKECARGQRSAYAELCVCAERNVVLSVLVEVARRHARANSRAAQVRRGVTKFNAASHG